MSGKKVIVIGAGMSGAKSARDLSAAGHDVIVLEARDRMGGRIWTNRDFGYPMDIGASWIHGIKKNPVHDLARRLNTELLTWDYDDLKYYADDDQALLQAYGAYSREFGKASQRVYRNNPKANVQDAVDAVQQTGKFGHLSAGEFALLAKWEFEQSYATDAKDLAVATFFEGGDEFGGDDVLFPNGYDALVQHLLDGVDVRYGERVKTIAHSESGVSISTETGSYEADFAVVTLSVCVLKSGTVEFSPSLPKHKQEAISGLEMGLLNKLCLSFDEEFWDDFSHLVAAPDARASWPIWFNLTDLSQRPTLVCMNSGDLAREIETWSDEDTVSSAMSSLRKMYGDQLPEPNAFLVTRWAEDPFARGSYSHWMPGGGVSLNRALAEPVGARLYFAGEATEDTHYATVHGAFLSGERAAAEILAEI